MADKKAKVVVSSGLSGRLEVGRWGTRELQKLELKIKLRSSIYMIIPFGCEDVQVCSTSPFV